MPLPPGWGCIRAVMPLPPGWGCIRAVVPAPPRWGCIRAVMPAPPRRRGVCCCAACIVPKCCPAAAVLPLAIELLFTLRQQLQALSLLSIHHHRLVCKGNKQKQQQDAEWAAGPSYHSDVPALTSKQLAAV